MTTTNPTSLIPGTPTPPARTATPTLRQLLDAELTYDTDAHHGFTSHASMGLIAAFRLGADDATLQNWFEAEEAEGYLIRRPAPPEWLAPLTAEIERRGIDAVVAEHLPDLVDRTGGFFHWMIRLELAIDIDNPAQVANALGDWARRPRPETPAPPPEGRTGNADPDEVLAETAAWVAALHWELDDFTTLHLVTGTRAARALAPYLDEDDRRRLAFAHHRAVNEVVARRLGKVTAPALTSEPSTSHSWEAIAAAAIATGNDHIVKLAYAAQLEKAATGRSIYGAIAERAAAMS